MMNEITEPLYEEIKALKEENRQLKLHIDDVKQYGQMFLVRMSGISEVMGENSTDRILVADFAGFIGYSYHAPNQINV